MTTTVGKEICVYGELIPVNEKNAITFKSLSKKYGIDEELLAVIWGYISQAITDCRDANERANKPIKRRASAERIYKEYDFLLTEYSNRLDYVADILPALGCRAATPESLYYELRNELR